MKAVHVLPTVLLLTLAGTIRAQDGPGEAAPVGPRITGFVDASYSGNLDRGGDGFRLDQVEVDLEHATTDGLVLRADLESDGDGSLAVEQGWLRLPLPLVSDWTLTVGKFNAPLGVELLDAPDMYQYSHSLLFDHALPTNLTGAMTEGPLAGPADLKLYVVNGWDVNDETNESRSVGARLGLDLGRAGSLGLSMLTGREEAVKSVGGEDLRILDADYQWRPLDGLLLFAEVNLGSVKPVGGSAMDWSGWMLGGHFDMTEMWGLTWRVDSIHDSDAVLFGRVAGEPQTRMSLTAAVTAALGSGRGMLLEARMDRSDQDDFLDADGAASSSTMGMALEFTQTF
ncbi:MAG: outer membrane beta-barrel protein [bacterium]|jgi:hypothetical protein|nr:outer membrane beta-barrel protein [bacterium]